MSCCSKALYWDGFTLLQAKACDHCSEVRHVTCFLWIFLRRREQLLLKLPKDSLCCGGHFTSNISIFIIKFWQNCLKRSTGSLSVKKETNNFDGKWHCLLSPHVAVPLKKTNRSPDFWNILLWNIIFCNYSKLYFPSEKISLKQQ